MSVNHNLKVVLAPFFKHLFKGKGHILMLHRIVEPSDNPRIHNPVNEISPAKLEHLIEFYINQGIQIVSLDDIKLFLTGQRNGRFVAFTFDDGYKDNLQLALPIFEKYHAPFTVYIATGFPDRKIVIWWYLLERILLSSNSIQFKWGGEDLKISVSTHEQKEKAFDKIRRLIIDTPYKTQYTYLREAFQHYTNNPFELTRELSMSWDEINQLSNSTLVTIGAHTINHPALNQLSEEEIAKEVLGSRKRLIDKTAKSIEHFSYPFGSSKEVGRKEIDVVSGLGFKTCVTTRIGNILKGHVNFTACLPRIPIGPNTSLDYLKGYNSGISPFISGARKPLVTV